MSSRLRDGRRAMREGCIMAEPGRKFAMRSVDADDTAAILALVDADWLPGQPRVTADMLHDAQAGRSSVDSGWWEELAIVSTVAATGPTEGVVGVVSYATRPRDEAGVILWLHGGEDDAVVSALLEEALSQLAHTKTVEAFSFATALGLGLEALPLRHRPATHRALLTRGFISTDLWRYMRADLPVTGLPTVTCDVSTDGDRRTLTVVNDGHAVAEATIGLPVQGIGVLWWITVEPAARGRGLGKAVLGSALAELARLGTVEVILYVDDDEPGGERDRTAANRLYEQVGFVEVDRLVSYRLDRTSG
jgi:ribosomal protein S18 acetylase RimI-like enzyme